mmetsp:Transcript_12602/g.27153  ORF Transcript_12602/g.27153 Transcript_12602/m.27153 type:complete len:1830 (-) Transcript_12602:41-5530(-)
MSASASDSIVLEEEIDPNYEPSEKEVVEYARWLGMDLEADQDLVWIAREGLKAPLPENWKPCKTMDTKEIYYFNFANGESTWDHPCDAYYRNLYEEEKKRSNLTHTSLGSQNDNNQKKSEWNDVKKIVKQQKELSINQEVKAQVSKFKDVLVSKPAGHHDLNSLKPLPGITGNSFDGSIHTRSFESGRGDRPGTSSSVTSKRERKKKKVKPVGDGSYDAQALRPKSRQHNPSDSDEDVKGVCSDDYNDIGAASYNSYRAKSSAGRDASRSPSTSNRRGQSYDEERDRLEEKLRKLKAKYRNRIDDVKELHDQELRERQDELQQELEELDANAERQRMQQQSMNDKKLAELKEKHSMRYETMCNEHEDRVHELACKYKEEREDRERGYKEELESLRREHTERFDELVNEGKMEEDHVRESISRRENEYSLVLKDLSEKEANAKKVEKDLSEKEANAKKVEKDLQELERKLEEKRKNLEEQSREIDSETKMIKEGRDYKNDAESKQLDTDLKAKSTELTQLTEQIMDAQSKFASVESEYNAFMSKLKAAKVDFDQEQVKLENVREKLIEESSKLEELQNQAAKEKSRLISIEDESSVVESKLCSTKGELHRAESNLKEKQSSLEAKYMQAKRSHEVEMKSLVREVEAKKDEISELGKKRGQLMDELDHLEGESETGDKLRNLLDASQKQASNLEGALDEKETLIATLQKELDMAAMEKERLEAAMEDERKSFEEKINDVSSTCASLEEDLTELREKEKADRQLLAIERQSKAGLEKKIASLQHTESTDAPNLSDKLKKAEAMIDQLQTGIAETVASKECVEKKLVSVQSKFDQLDGEHTTYKDNVKFLESQLEAERKSVRDKMKHIRDLESSTSTPNNDNSLLLEEVDDLHKKLEESKIMYENLMVKHGRLEREKATISRKLESGVELTASLNKQLQEQMEKENSLVLNLHSTEKALEETKSQIRRKDMHIESVEAQLSEVLSAVPPPSPTSSNLEKAKQRQQLMEEFQKEREILEDQLEKSIQNEMELTRANGKLRGEISNLKHKLKISENEVSTTEQELSKIKADLENTGEEILTLRAQNRELDSRILEVRREEKRSKEEEIMKNTLKFKGELSTAATRERELVEEKHFLESRAKHAEVELTSRVKHAEMQANSFRDKAELAESQKSELEASFDALSQERQQLQSKIHDLLKELAQVKQSNEAKELDYESKLDLLRNEKMNLDVHYNSLKSQNGSHKSDKESLLAEIERLRIEATENESKLRLSDKENYSLKNKLNSISSENAELKKTQIEVAEEVEEIEESRRTFESKVGSLESQNQSLSSKLRRLENALANLETQNEALKKHKLELELEKTTLESSKFGLEANHDDIESANSELRVKVSTLESLNSRLNHDVKALNDQKAKLETTTRTLKEKLREFENRIKNLDEETRKQNPERQHTSASTTLGSDGGSADGEEEDLGTGESSDDLENMLNGNQTDDENILFKARRWVGSFKQEKATIEHAKYLFKKQRGDLEEQRAALLRERREWKQSLKDGLSESKVSNKVKTAVLSQFEALDDGVVDVRAKLNWIESISRMMYKVQALAKRCLKCKHTNPSILRKFHSAHTAYCESRNFDDSTRETVPVDGNDSDEYDESFDTENELYDDNMGVRFYPRHNVNYGPYHPMSSGQPRMDMPNVAYAPFPYQYPVVYVDGAPREVFSEPQIHVAVPRARQPLAHLRTNENVMNGYVRRDTPSHTVSASQLGHSLDAQHPIVYGDEQPSRALESTWNESRNVAQQHSAWLMDFRKELQRSQLYPRRERSNSYGHMNTTHRKKIRRRKHVRRTDAKLG